MEDPFGARKYSDIRPFGYPRSVPIHKLKIVLFGFKFKLKEKRSESKTDFESQVKFELYK